MTAKVKKIPKEEPPMDLDTKQQLPEPKGWKVLVAMPKSKEKTDGGIIKAAQTGKVGDGKILVSDLKNVYRIRTEESGIDALAEYI